MKSLTKTSLALAIGLASSFTYAQGAATQTPAVEDSATVETPTTAAVEAPAETEAATETTTATVETEETTEAASTTAEKEDTAEASTEESSGLEEVLVTAQKREQNLQDTPVAVSAFDKAAIDDQVIRDISDLSTSIPNVSIAPSPGGSTGATIAIRGASTVNPAVTWEPAAGIYFDGVFVAKNTGGLFDIAELERVEVLRGPQGTLYGKNTTGGAINLITRKPSEDFGGWVKAGGGNYGFTEYAASIDSGKLGDVVSINIAYNKRDRDGFYDNLSVTSSIDEFKKLDSEAMRISALFDLTDDLDIYYSYDQSEKNNTVAFGQLELLDFTTNPISLPKMKRKDQGSLNGAGEETSESSGHSLHITYDINDGMTFKSITAYREMAFADSNDYDGTDVTIFHTSRDVEQDQFSQEFQLIGETDSFNYVVGAFYFNDDADADNPFDVGITLKNSYGVESTSTAVYGQADWALTDAFTLTGGLRWTQEEKDAYMSRNTGLPFEVSATGNETWNNVSPMLIASYAFTNELNTYAKVARGWKAGGFNAEAATQVEAETPYDEETLTSYEIGMKARWFDILQTNIAVFMNDITDLQVASWNTTTNASVVSNAGEAQTMGLELEAILSVTDSLTAFFNYGYLDAEYKDFIGLDAGGNPAQQKDVNKFAYSPKQTASLGLEYVQNIGFADLRVRADYAYIDEQYFYSDAFAAYATKADSYSVLNARVALTELAITRDNTLEIGIWGKNLTDEEYRVNGIPTSAGAVNYYGDPLTYGADVTYKF